MESSSTLVLCTDQDNHIYVADSNNHRIQVLNVDGSFLHKFGEQGSQDGQLGLPEAMCMESGKHKAASPSLTKPTLE
jgi:hypothetical protein